MTTENESLNTVNVAPELSLIANEIFSTAIVIFSHMGADPTDENAIINVTEETARSLSEATENVQSALANVCADLNVPLEEEDSEGE